MNQRGQRRRYLLLTWFRFRLFEFRYLAGVSKEAKDRKGRTVIDIACMHRYAAANVTGQFGGSPEEHCNPKHLIPTTAPLPTKSLAPAGWRKPKGLSGTPPESHCDFDVRTDLSVEEFLFDYLALQRPLLIRSATKGTKWDRLRRAWSRKQLATDYGDTLLHVRCTVLNHCDRLVHFEMPSKITGC